MPKEAYKSPEMNKQPKLSSAIDFLDVMDEAVKDCDMALFSTQLQQQNAVIWPMYFQMQKEHLIKKI